MTSALSTTSGRRNLASRPIDEVNAALEALVHGVLTVDACHPQRLVLYINRAFADLTGHQAGDAPGGQVTRFTGRPTDLGLQQRFDEALQSGHCFTAEWLVPRKGGDAFWGRISTRPLLRTDRSLARILVTLEDISVSRQLGQSLRASETRLELALQASQQDRQEAIEVARRWERAVRGTCDGLYDCNLLTGQVWYATRFRAILGYTGHDFPNTFHAFHNALHEEDRGLVMGKIRAHLENRKHLDIRCRVVTRSGETRWCRLRGEAERDAGGRPTRLAGSLSDINAQINAQEALHRSEDFYGTILDSLPLFIVYVDDAQRVVYANRMSQEFFGLSASGSRGRTIKELIGEARYRMIAAEVHMALQGRVMESHGRFEGAAGRAADLEAVFIPHRDDGEEIHGCFVTARDVTEKRQLEAELRQSQKMEAVGRLTGGIAHDFNNLLSVIVGNMQLLARSLHESPALLRQVDAALNAAMRGASLTRRLLAFARQQVLEPRVVDLNTLIGGMYELLRRTLTGDVEIKRDSAADVWPMRVDPGQLENAVLNLVINARDALPSGGVITICTRNAVIRRDRPLHQEGLAPGEYVLLEVCDNGMGMSAQTLKRVFEPFFTTKDVGRGSGLGLSMVYGFVKQSGGHIHITSRLEQGTSVYLYFPRTHDTAHVTAERVAVETGPELDLPGGHETILVVEDNQEVRATVVDILGSLGYRLLEAGDGHEALALVERHADVALVFCNIMLPGGLLGPQLIRRILDRRAGVKTLMTSGFAETSVMHRGLPEASTELLPKPYKVEDLARRIRAKLDGKEEADCVPL